MAVLVRTDLLMSKGTIAERCGHAILGAYKDALKWEVPALAAWEAGGSMKIVLKVHSKVELCTAAKHAMERNLPLSIVTEAGLTQVAAETQTVCAIGPALPSVFEELGFNDFEHL
eukprot:gnl/TRDRNA2_/TRDRNA2_137184_c2_seq1.p2 gnl/TRDRNA2_/TRDRNA2_137184_c2~~gnl/TRDRNA2_/TRDRNA2_137184_c2_seq1.p2  ORF type:complete len:115 (-),score=26.24 gnl/TRDRNA2_/TRDRNA2_137184_c2_seq1:138-482(-)